jgi:hypothetical protein
MSGALSISLMRGASELARIAIWGNMQETPPVLERNVQFAKKNWRAGNSPGDGGNRSLHRDGRDQEISRLSAEDVVPVK